MQHYETERYNPCHIISTHNPTPFRQQHYSSFLPFSFFGFSSSSGGWTASPSSSDMKDAITSRVNSRSFSLEPAGFPFGPVTTFKAVVVDLFPTKAGDENPVATIGRAKQRAVESFMVMSSSSLVENGAAQDFARSLTYFSGVLLKVTLLGHGEEGPNVCEIARWTCRVRPNDIKDPVFGCASLT